VWFILEFYITQILISTTYIFECISRLINVTDNNDARWKMEIERKKSYRKMCVLIFSTNFFCNISHSKQN
jgi:hypothetical protein